MKYRDSGMPEQAYWDTLFDVPLILDWFGFGVETGDTAELGCGYGTFTLPLAARTRSVVHAYDIDPAMVACSSERAARAGLSSIRFSLRDVFAHGFDLPDASCGSCLLFNILHGEAPEAMLLEAARVVRPGGVVAVIHWRSDVATPRGPELAIRPRPEHILHWAGRSRFPLRAGEPMLLPPWHFGLSLRRVDG